MNETRQLFGRDDMDVLRGQLLRDPVSREALAGAIALSVVTRRSASRKSSRRWKNASSTCVRSAKIQTRGDGGRRDRARVRRCEDASGRKDRWNLDRGVAVGALAITLEVYDEHHESQNALRARSPGRWDGVHECIWMRREHCAPA